MKTAKCPWKVTINEGGFHYITCVWAKSRDGAIGRAWKQRQLNMPVGWGLREVEQVETIVGRRMELLEQMYDRGLGPDGTSY